MPEIPAPSMRRDIASAYVLTASRIVGWIVVSALVYRRLGATAFAMLTLVRSTVGLLANTSLGLAPAMIWKFAGARALTAPSAVSVEADLPIVIGANLESEKNDSIDSPASIYSSGLALACLLAIAGILASVLYGWFFPQLHRVPTEFAASTMFVMATTMGLGITLRMISDAPAAVLQTSDRIALDNLLLAGAEILWVALSTSAIMQHQSIAAVGVSLLVSNLALLIARLIAARPPAVRLKVSQVHRRIILGLLAFGSFVAIAELADFLYAPTDYILINRLLDPAAVATYAPAVQIDGALLLMVSAIAEVLLPKTALAHHAGNRELVRRYYFVGTLATAGILIFCSVGAYFISPAIFRFWLGKKLLDTRAILPLILIHTVIGGSSIVGRSILLGMGKVRPFTFAVICAGTANVILSYCFVRFCGFGLRGIILGTIVAVVGRCAIWMPWYVMRSLRE